MLALRESGLSPLHQVCYTALPENETLIKIARLYASVFADPPWNEYKLCSNGHFFGKELSDLTTCIKCNEELRIAYPEKETAEYIAGEVGMPDPTLVTFEGTNGEVVAAGWGYTCSSEELQGKYRSPEMKELVGRKLEETGRKVQKLFYLSEIMVDTSARRRGLGTTIARRLSDVAEELNVHLVLRTNSRSPMVLISEKMGMSRIISPGEDAENGDRVLYLRM